jgi:hypothetical protein
MVMVSTLSGVAQYKILYDQAELTNTSSCVMNTISKSCPVKRKNLNALEKS